MDIDFFKSSSSSAAAASDEDQMEMMLLMQMGKIPPFSHPLPIIQQDFTNSQQHHLSRLSRSCCFSGEEKERTTTEFSGNNNNSSMAAMREMIFRIAAMQPVNIDPESVRPPKRRNVKISTDPQSVAARHRRERISERIRILQRLVPGGTKMDTASMLDEAIHYVQFLKNQVESLERVAATNTNTPSIGNLFPVEAAATNGHHFHSPPPPPPDSANWMMN